MDSELRVSDRQPKALDTLLVTDGDRYRPPLSFSFSLLFRCLVSELNRSETSLGVLLLCSSFLTVDRSPWDHGCEEPVAPAPPRGPPAVHRDPVRADPGDRRLDLARADLQGLPRPGDGPAAPEPASRARLPPPAHEAAVPPHPARGGVRRGDAGGQETGAREEAPPQGAAVARRGGGRGGTTGRAAGRCGGLPRRSSSGGSGSGARGGQGGGGGERRGGRVLPAGGSPRAAAGAERSRKGSTWRRRTTEDDGDHRATNEKKPAAAVKKRAAKDDDGEDEFISVHSSGGSQDSRQAAREVFQSQLEGFHPEGEGGEDDWETSAAVQATISESIRQQQELHGGITRRSTRPRPRTASGPRTTARSPAQAKGLCSLSSSRGGFADRGLADWSSSRPARGDGLDPGMGSIRRPPPLLSRVHGSPGDRERDFHFIPAVRPPPPPSIKGDFCRAREEDYGKLLFVQFRDSLVEMGRKVVWSKDKVVQGWVEHAEGRGERRSPGSGRGRRRVGDAELEGGAGRRRREEEIDPEPEGRLGADATINLAEAKETTDSAHSKGPVLLIPEGAGAHPSKAKGNLPAKKNAINDHKEEGTAMYTGHLLHCSTTRLRDRPRQQPSQPVISDCV
ncbi:hypothetical protein THAOC_07208 [Thalassiosira oceanica]|uniref:Uncharacterized protein n=1 Tax=Thalassiosira oceanica TaxID=159749 RepID=K0SY54_THAOC|nr:hypothetical protein THAOC_07208 [Thalassiosira oceanica]|eukprot:EJK71363.1 hypothetical protein THAOC_07208 [Thalassiosira oceanica]